MVKHIVMFKLRHKTPETLQKAIETLRSLEGRVPSLLHIEVGEDFKGSERSYDIVLTTYFDDRDGLASYATHPNHIPVIETMRELCSSSVVVDYEVG